MIFFNQKEEVIDVQLTQFGKNSLSRGVFKPVYYRFFDDDVIYNIEKSGRVEHQNETQDRILKQTPRLKTLHLSYGVETKYFLDDEQILSGTMERFIPLVRNFDPELQETILSYPIGNKETGTQAAPVFSVLSKDAAFTGSISYLTSSGIVNRIPQIEINPSIKITKDFDPNLEYDRALNESHYDLMSDEIVFKDGTRLLKNSKNILLDIEEVGSFYGLENFEIELYEIITGDQKNSLRRIEKIEDIRKLFKIKTDEDADHSIDLTLKNTNYSRRDD